MRLDANSMLEHLTPWAGAKNCSSNPKTHSGIALKKNGERSSQPKILLQRESAQSKRDGRAMHTHLDRVAERVSQV